MDTTTSALGIEETNRWLSLDYSNVITIFVVLAIGFAAGLQGIRLRSKARYGEYEEVKAFANEGVASKFTDATKSTEGTKSYGTVI